MRHQPQLSRRVLWAGITVGVMLATAVSSGVAAGWWTVGSPDGGWMYPYVAPLAPRQLLVFAAVAAAACVLLAVPARPRTIKALILAWILFASAAHAVIRTSAPFDIETIFLSPGANGFYTMAREWSPGEMLSSFNRARRHAPLHAQSNMPGKTLLVHALETVSARTDVLPWLVVLLSNLGAVLMFGLARALFDDERTGLYAAVLYLFTPGRVLFFPLMNTVTPLIVLGFAWLVVAWLRSGRTGYVVAAGMALYGLVLFEPLPLVMGLFVAALGMAAIVRGEISVERFAVQVGLMALVCGALAAAMFEMTGFHTWRAFVQIGEHAVEFNQTAGRPYEVWILANLGEFMFTTGPAQLVLAFAALAAAGRPAGRRRDRFTRPVVVASSGLLAVLVTTDLLGVNRGEVARLWIFLACFFQLPAAYVCGALGHRAAIAAVLVVTLLQVCLAAAAIGFVVP